MVGKLRFDLPSKSRRCFTACLQGGLHHSAGRESQRPVSVTRVIDLSTSTSRVHLAERNLLEAQTPTPISRRYYLRRSRLRYPQIIARNRDFLYPCLTSVVAVRIFTADSKRRRCWLPKFLRRPPSVARANRHAVCYRDSPAHTLRLGPSIPSVARLEGYFSRIPWLSGLPLPVRIWRNPCIRKCRVLPRRLPGREPWCNTSATAGTEPSFRPPRGSSRPLLRRP